MDVVKYLREVARKCHLSDSTGDELARLRTENEFLRATLDSADQAMAAGAGSLPNSTRPAPWPLRPTPSRPKRP